LVYSPINYSYLLPININKKTKAKARQLSYHKYHNMFGAQEIAQ
jgi:hypothetical protein